MSATSRKGPVFDPGLCRCCGSIKKCRLLNVEYEFQGQKEVYSDMFVDCFGLMLSHLDGTVETERLVCATCVQRLRDACAFRRQVLQCEDRLLQTFIHVHPHDVKVEVDVKIKVVKVETEPGNDLNLLETLDNGMDRIDADDNSAPVEDPRLKHMDEEDRQFFNTTCIIENSFVCPFETSFSEYHCVYCGEVFTEPQELRDHTMTHDPTTYKDLVKIIKKIPQIDILRIDCRLCNEKIRDLDSFKTHITAIHGKYLFKNIKNEVLQFRLASRQQSCVVCNATFRYFHPLRNHMAVHYGSCVCDVCGLHFFEERKLILHQKSHKKPEERYVCKECGKDFKSRNGRYMHITKVHRKVPTFQCGKCDAVFFTYALKSRHRIEIHGEKRIFACEHCDRSYDTRKSWHDHNRRAHVKNFKHKCEICDVLYYLPSELKEHMTTHTGERNFKCEFCGKSYPRIKALRLHMKSHSENKYKCEICNAVFTQNVSLRNHVKRQHQIWT